MLAEAEVAVNGRALTCLEDDGTSTDVFTPSPFVVGKRLATLPAKRENLALSTAAPDIR